MYEENTNRLLKSLPEDSRTELLSHAALVELNAHQRLSEVGKAPRNAYFMLSGFASELIELNDGEVVEIGLVGSEGVTGTYHLLGRLCCINSECWSEGATISSCSSVVGFRLRSFCFAFAGIANTGSATAIFPR